MARGLIVNNSYERGVKKRTSIGDSSRTKPKNKHKRRQFKRGVGQGNSR